MKNPAWYLALFAVLLAQGCGYHLRGQGPRLESAAADYRVYVRAGATALADSLRAQLAAAGSRLSQGVQDADYTLTLYDENFERKVASVSPATGKVEEYLLVFTCRISISKPGGEDLVVAQLIRASGDYAFDEDAALGKFAEEETIREELIEQAAAQVVRRLDTLAE